MVTNAKWTANQVVFKNSFTHGGLITPWLFRENIFKEIHHFELKKNKLFYRWFNTRLILQFPSDEGGKLSVLDVYTRSREECRTIATCDTHVSSRFTSVQNQRKHEETTKPQRPTPCDQSATGPGLMILRGQSQEGRCPSRASLLTANSVSRISRESANQETALWTWRDWQRN